MPPVKRVLVLGGDGMLGGMVHRVLRGARDVLVAATSRRDLARPFLDAEHGLEALRRFFAQGDAWDYVVNCIGVLRSSIREADPPSVERAVRVNAVFPYELARVAEENASAVIHISTDGLFSANAGVCYEDTPPDGTDAYGKSKYLGEVHGPGFLTLRCSIVGPDPLKRSGLLEWFLSRSAGEQVPGYIDHRWNGVTSLQFAQLCRGIIEEDGVFDALRSAGPVHHFCPNLPVTKCELLETLQSVFGSDLRIQPVESPDGPMTRVLGTRYTELHGLFGEDLSMRRAVEQLAADMHHGAHLHNSAQQHR